MEQRINRRAVTCNFRLPTILYLDKLINDAPLSYKQRSLFKLKRAGLKLSLLKMTLIYINIFQVLSCFILLQYLLNIFDV